MAAIVATVNQKGGVGKSTLALNLASVLHSAGNRVILVDADPQGSSSRWSRQTGGNHGFSCLFLDVNQGASRFNEALNRLRQKADIVMIDTPPELANNTLLATLLAHVILIPVTPSPFDVWGAEAAVNMARGVRMRRGGRLPVALMVPNKLKSGTMLAKALPDTLARLGEPVAPAISDRVVVVEAVRQGKTIDHYAHRSPAHLEFAELGALVMRILKQLGEL
jgi:chromosome partitioning protein